MSGTIFDYESVTSIAAIGLAHYPRLRSGCPQ
jgi:hypothetical protein